MNKLVKLSLFVSALLLISCDKEDVDPFDFVEGTRYQITFTVDWSKAKYPTDYPGNAHFSKLIGWSHDSTSTLFEVGTEASYGIEVMAETGGTDHLESEFRTLIEDGEGLDAFIGSNLETGSGTITVDLALDTKHTSVTLATMIAPSPDWYVAVVNVNLFEDGGFVDTKTVDAHVYDSGTDSGVTYGSADMDTDPQEPISLFVDGPIGNGTEVDPVIATVTFKRID